MHLILLALAATPALAQPAVMPAGIGERPAAIQLAALDRRDRRRANRRVWRGRDGRYRCERDDGTEGLVIGALGGGILGHEVAGENDETEGTIIGGVAGALIGREIDRDVDCR